MIKADLHTHLRTGSIFNKRDFNRAIDLAAKRLGTQEGAAFALVNFEDKRYEQFIGLPGYEREYVGPDRNAIYIPKKKVLVVKGQEMPTKQGHLLVLGLEADIKIKSDMSLKDTIDAADDNLGTIIAAHPFYIHGMGNYLIEYAKNIRKTRGEKDNIKSIDAIEIHNGGAALTLPLSKKLPERANEHAEEFHRIARTAGYKHLGALSVSDGHSFYELGKSWTEIDMPNLSENYFKTSLKREVRSQGPRRMCMVDCKLGTIDHIIDLIYLKMLQRFGINSGFETEKAKSS